MKQQNTFYLLCLSLCFLFGCSATKKVAIPEIKETTIADLSRKMTRLTPEQRKYWWHADLLTDTIPGISLDKAYAFLAGKKSTTVVVAVTDTGLDTEHEDLKDVLWTNSDEIAGNGVDDDKNGFVDDIHGWNFLGDTYNENLEQTRMYRNYKKRFGDRTEADMAPDEVAAFKDYLKLQQEMKGQISDRGYYFNPGFNAREGMEDPYDFSIKVYGDNKVKNKEPSEMHATHVAGIIAANRTNTKGMKGVADNVKIMSLRIVPKGDEYDKDVALGIRYAADNGAKIINASFGKSHSSNPEWVHDAIKYAAEKDVLIVLSSGNSGQNIDKIPTYPNDTPDNRTEIADNVIMVGANSFNYDENITAAFSNYGKRNVDVFAPGVSIYSSVPNGRYQSMGGTSMAAPATAGIAALVRSYYPDLTAGQVKKIIMESGTKINIDVMIPGGETTLLSMDDLCVSGRVVNAFGAVKMAAALSKE